MIRTAGRPTHAELPGCPTPNQIKADRMAVGLSREAAAGLIGRSLRSWVRWENGESAMHPDVWAQWRNVVMNGEDSPVERPPAAVLALRRASGMTQEQIAGVVGVSTSAWQGWEKGRASMSEPLFQRACNAIAAALETRLQHVRSLVEG